MATQIGVNVYAIDCIPQPTLSGIEVYLPTKGVFVQEYEAQNNPHVNSLVTFYPNPNSRSKTQEFQVWETVDALETAANTDGNSMFAADVYAINQSFLKNGGKQFLFPNDKPSIWAHEDGNIHSLVTFKGNDYYTNDTQEALAEAANEGGGGGSSYLVATIELTDAQIKAWNATPVVLIAGQAGKIIFPQFIVLRFVPAAENSEYTNISANGQIVVSVGLGSNVSFVIDEAVNTSISNLLGDDGDSAAIAYSTPVMNVNGAFTAGVSDALFDGDLVNTALNIYVNNTGAYGGGNAGNILNVTVYYLEYSI